MSFKEEVFAKILDDFQYFFKFPFLASYSSNSITDLSFNYQKNYFFEKRISIFSVYQSQE